MNRTDEKEEGLIAAAYRANCGWAEGLDLMYDGIDMGEVAKYNLQMFFYKEVKGRAQNDDAVGRIHDDPGGAAAGDQL